MLTTPNTNPQPKPVNPENWYNWLTNVWPADKKKGARFGQSFMCHFTPAETDSVLWNCTDNAKAKQIIIDKYLV